MRPASFQMGRGILAAALIGVGALTLPALAFADRDHDHDGKESKKVQRAEALVLTNGKIHTMDGSNRVVSEVLISNGRFVGVGSPKDKAEKDKRDKRIKDAVNIDLREKTVIPGIVDAHNHIVLVGNRPGWHTGAEDVFTIADLVKRYQERAAEVPPGEFITTVGPVAAMQLAEQRLPNLTELDAVPRPVFIIAAQGGTRMNSAAKAYLEARESPASAPTARSPAPPPASRCRRCGASCSPPRRGRTRADAFNYYNTLGITTHHDKGAFQSDTPSTGVANENNYAMHIPFLELARAGRFRPACASTSCTRTPRATRT